MTRGPFLVVIVLWAAALAVAGPRADAPPVYDWQLPKNFPQPRVPANNPMSAAKAELGRHLFYDTRLSGNGTQSCATCHKQELAFTDGRDRALGSTGEVHSRGSMSLVNVAYAAALTWGNPSVTQLEEQALVPMFGDHPIELGLQKPGAELVTRLRSDARYRDLFAAAFGSGADAISLEHVTQALATFERTILSARSPYDRYHTDRDDAAISTAARRGETVFFSTSLSCFHCHGGFLFSDAVTYDGARGSRAPFHNTGLYNLSGLLSYPAGGLGVYDATNRAEDVGRFKAVSLRNVAVTAPYMHDGSIATLEDVVAHYAAGGRTIVDGPNRGVGRDNPHKAQEISGFALTSDQRADLVAFLQSLTDDAVLHDPRFSNPWTQRSRP